MPHGICANVQEGFILHQKQQQKIGIFAIPGGSSVYPAILVLK